ncbi:cupin domain-containing protein [Halospeciosus flavus]|uniref:Cupin domain-containing protein n=1 Tax=Halospeciosus flavus TaxID=3032283 RepID=A0ABD5Z5H8_9EURY|nr:cupin domain-containing protein [Halospeciosus flavus]
MAHNVVHTDDVPLTEFGGTMGESNVKLRDIGEVLAADTAAVKVWYIDSGESLPVSGNNDREEICYVLDGYFSLTAGPAEGGDEVEFGPGTFLSTTHADAHGYRNVGDKRGVVISFEANPQSSGNDPEEIERSTTKE